MNKKLKRKAFIQNRNITNILTLRSVCFSLSFFGGKNDTCIQQVCVKLIKSDSKDLYLLQKIFIFSICTLSIPFQKK